MKRLIFLISFLAYASISFSQFSDTSQLNAFIRDTIKDRRPEKVTAAQIQKAMFGLSKFSGSAGPGASVNAPILTTLANLRLQTDPGANAVYFVYDKGYYGTFIYDAADVTSVDDTATVVVAGTKRYKRQMDEVVYPEWWLAKGDGTTDDGPRFNAMYRWIERNPNRKFQVAHRNQLYLINTQVNLPYLLTSSISQLRRFTIDGGGVTYKTTVAGNVLYRRPVNQTDALNSVVVGYALSIDGLKIEGTGLAGQVGLNLSALYTPIISGCNFTGLDTAIVATYWLNGTIKNNFFTNNKSVAFKGASGEYYWPGATTSNSAFNINLFTGNEIGNYGGAFAGIMILGADGCIVREHISEGGNPRYDIYNDSQGAPVVNGNKYENIWFESSGGPYAKNTCFFMRPNGTTWINGIQNDHADTLFKINSPAGNAHFVIQNIQYYPSTGKMFDAGGVTNAGVTLDVTNCSFLYANMFEDTARWVGGVIGLEMFKYGRDNISTANINLNLRPNFNGPLGNQILYIAGNVFSAVDNVSYWSFGGNYTGGLKSRFHTGWFGDGGLWVSPSGKYGFGNVSSDVDYLNRPAAGRYNFNGTGQLHIPSGTVAQRVAATAGDIRYNLDSVNIEGYYNSKWNQLADKDWVRNNTSSGVGSVNTVGNTASRPTGVTGKLHFNTDTGTTEQFDGSFWTALADREFVRSLIVSGTGNKFAALSLTDYGGVSNAVVSGSGVTGTDNTPMLNAMIAASKAGQMIIIPEGNYAFLTPVTDITFKRLNLWVIGNTYHNNVNWIKVKWGGSGPYISHNIVHMGEAYGTLGMPSHSKANYDAGTGPNWAALTNVLVRIENTYRTHVQLFKVEGFKAPVQIIGGGGIGSQENTVAAAFFNKNAVGILLTSTDGASYCDKNTFTGLNGGTIRISGGLGIQMDGYAPAAWNGENFNGAFRSNEFHILIEEVDSIAECHGDITDNEFDVTVEAGNATGVYGMGWRMRSVAPNYVRDPKYRGNGVFNHHWLLNGMGIGGTINVPVWNIGVRYGDLALINEIGDLVFLRTSLLSKTNIDNAPSNFKFVTWGEAEESVNIASAAYTVAPRTRRVYYTHATGNCTLPAAANAVGRFITIYNDHATAALTVSNVRAGSKTSIPAGSNVTYECDGVNWRSLH